MPGRFTGMAGLRDADVVKPSTRLFIAGAAAAATTANAIRPVGRGRRLAMPAFALGLGPSEFPLHTGLAQLAIGGLLSRSGGTRGWRGKLGIAAHVASVAGLVVVYRTARKASGVLDAALAEGLGADYRSRVREPFAPRPEVALTGRQLVAPEHAARGGAIGRRATSATASSACATSSTCGSAATSAATPERPCCSRSTVVPGRWAARRARPSR